MWRSWRGSFCLDSDPMKSLRLFCWFVFGLLLGGFCVGANASTTYSTQNVWTGPNGVAYASPTAACTVQAWHEGAFANVTSVTLTQLDPASYGANAWRCKGFNSSGSFVNQVDMTPAMGCPYGGSKSGSSCVGAPDCSAGQVRDAATGQCVTDCAAKAGQTAQSGFFDMGSAATATGSKYGTGCYGGCTAILQNGDFPAATSLVNGVTHYYLKGTYVWASGLSQAQSACTASGATGVGTLPTSTCAAGQGTATMGGKTVCVDLSTGAPANTTGSASTTPGTVVGAPVTVNGVTTQTTTTTYGDGSSLATTTTTNADGSKTVTYSAKDPYGNQTTSYQAGTAASTGWSSQSGTGGTSTGSTAGSGTGTGAGSTPSQTPGSADPNSDICKLNPTASACQTKTAGGGESCTAAPSCGGDAIQCEIVFQVWKRGCDQKLFDGQGSPSNTEELQEQSTSAVTAITPVSIGGAGTCPADVQLPRGAVFSWNGVCTYASALRPIVLLLAWLSAGAIVFGWRNG